MSKLKMTIREIGSVCVFDLVGEATLEAIQEVATRIQRNIRRHRLQRVILNLQMMPTLEPLGIRKLLAACIRPQKSLIYGVAPSIAHFFEDTYVPRNVRICTSEKEVAEDFGPFLLDKNRVELGSVQAEPEAPTGKEIERRRSKRMHVALPIELKFEMPGGSVLETRAIATNISEHGLFAEYLDLESAATLDALNPIEGTKVEVLIHPSANFPEEYHLRGRIVRKEFRKKQFGTAVEFLS